MPVTDVAAADAAPIKAGAPRYLRINQIVGQKQVSEEQAQYNRRIGKGPRRPREAIPALIPISESSWWAGVKSGRYPKPLKISERITVWRTEDIQALMRNDMTKVAA